MKYIKDNYKYLTFCFFVISILGWILELLYSLFLRGKLVNPGVLTGPWCQIYGVCFLLIIILVKKNHNKIYNIFKIFLIASLLEYISSYISDVFFNHIIWEYSNYPLNINGRICLHMSLIFTLFGYIMIYVINPFLSKIYLKNKITYNKISLILSILFCLDIILNIIF